MPNVNMAVLEQPQRLAAARRARRLLPGLTLPLDAVARLAARMTGSPMAIVAVMEVTQEHFVGSHGLPQTLVTGVPVPVDYSLCKYVVSADHAVVSDDMSADPDLRHHPPAVDFGARAFAGVPLRDADDRTVGSLLVVDVVPRRWTGQEPAALIEISALLAGLPGDRAAAGSDAMAGVDAATVLEGVQEAFVAVDAAGVIRGWNAAAQGLLGWPAAEASGRRADELLLTGDERARFREVLPELTSSPGVQTGWTGRVCVRHQDGGEVPARAVVSTVRTHEGPLVCVFLTDLTGQSEAERDAGTQRGFLTALLDSLAAPVAAADADGRLQVVNRAMRRQHGLPDDATPEDLVMAAALHLRDPDGVVLPPEKTPLLRALRGELVLGQEIVVTVPGEPVRTVLANAQPIVAAGDTPAGAVTTCADITEQRRIERFHECQLTVATAVAHTGDAHRSAAEITEAVATALRWPHVEMWLHDELTGTMRLAGHHSSLDDEFAGLVTRPIDRGVGVSGTVWATAEPLWVPDIANSAHLEGAALLTGVGEQVGGFLASRRSDRLASEVVRSKDDFLSLVGHEMRTPLTVISSSIDVLLYDTGADPDARVAHEAIARNAGTLRAIVDDLLDLAALESGHLQVSPRTMDLAEIARQALRQLQSSAQANGVTMTANVPRTLVTSGDPQRLRQVLDNLLSNAVKYSPDGGATTLTLTDDGQAVTLTIADTGIGIPPGERRFLFHRFHRASNARHTAVPGTGLGLSIVRAITEAHHGTVALEDGPGAGTTVTVRLPSGTTGATAAS